MDAHEKRRLARQITKSFGERQLTYSEAEEVMEYVKEELKSSTIEVEENSMYD